MPLSLELLGPQPQQASQSPVCHCTWAGFILSPTLGCSFPCDRLQLGHKLLLFGIHHCVLFSCYQRLLKMMTLLAMDVGDLCPSVPHTNRNDLVGSDVSHWGQLMLQLSLQVMPSVAAVKSPQIIFISESHGWHILIPINYLKRLVPWHL